VDFSYTHRAGRSAGRSPPSQGGGHGFKRRGCAPFTPV